MRPTSRSGSVDKVDVDLDALTSRGGAHDGADALGGTATTTDHPAQVTRPDFDFELQAVPALDRIHVHCFCIVDDRANDMGEHGGGGWCQRLIGGLDHLVGLVGPFAARAALNSAIAPDTSNSFLTRSVGCAPSINHFTALALSMLSVDGSVRGL